MTRPSARSRDEERAHTNGIVCALESASDELRGLHKRRVRNQGTKSAGGLVWGSTKTFYRVVRAVPRASNRPLQHGETRFLFQANQNEVHSCPLKQAMPGTSQSRCKGACPIADDNAFSELLSPDK